MATCDRTILIINNSVDGKSIDSNVDGSTDFYPHLLGRDASFSYWVIAEHYSGPILDLCCTYAIDGIILESHAPDLRGLNLLAHLKAQLGKRCPPIIVIDAHDINLARRAFQAGAADYLAREQVTAETLHQALDTAISSSHRAIPDTPISLSLGDRYRDLTESMDEGFCICQMLLNEDGAPVDYRFLEINSVFEALTGLQQPVGKTARELVPNLEKRWFETYGRVALAREPIRFEQQSVPMQRWFDVYAFPMGEPQHHLFGILFKNTTARKAMEQEREQFLAVGSDLQVITGHNGYFQWVSPAVVQVLGWTAAEITARPWREFVHPEDVDASILEADSLFSGNETFAFENRYRHKDGSYRWLLWRAQPSSTQQVIYGVAIDITAGKRRAAHTAFLAEIATEFSRLSSADETMQIIGAKVGEYLNLSVCAFAEIDDAEEEAVIHYAWHDDDMPDVVGTYHISDFVSDDFRKAAHNRETVVVQDTSTDPRADEEKYAALRIHSFVSVPFYKDGQWRFLLNVYDSVPRIWRDDEIELICELANQIFPRLKRVRAEAALRESEARFKGFAENSHDVIWITDANEYRLVYVSPSFEQVWGRSATELYDNLNRFVDFIHPEDRDRIQWGWQKCTQAAFSQEYRIVRPDGTLVWIRDRGFPIYNDQGEVLWIGGIAEDISERKRVEEILQQRETELRLVTNAVPSLISFIDADQCYRFNNHTYEDWFGKPAAATYGQHLREVLGEAAYEAIRPYVEQVLAGQQVTYESEVHYKEGGTRYINATYVPRFSNEGTVEGFVALVNDVSDRKRAEIALREREQRLDLATRTAKLGVFEWNVQADSAIWENAQMYDIFGHTQDDSILNKARSMNDVIHPDDREEFERCLAEGMKDGYFHATCRIRRLDDGQWSWVESIGQFELAADGTPLRLIGVLSDISKRKYSEAERERLLASERTARAQAEAANRVKDEFLAVVSHELRSPLNPILGWSQLLLKGQLDGQQTQRALEIIKRNAQMQAQLINDLLDVSRILRGKLSLNQQAVNLQVVVQAALETVRLAAEAKSIQIHTQLESDIGSVSGDADRLQQVAWNLLSNAVKFTPEGGRVEVRLERKNVSALEGERVSASEGESMDARLKPTTPPPHHPTTPLPHPPTHAQLTITDTGKGIHPDFLPHVFDRFRQESTTTTRQFGGLGLGLALVQYLVELHGGSVEADSPGEGQGATFTIKLPLMSQTSAMNQEVQRAKLADDLKGVNILVVDDDDSTREFLACLLELNGARVIVAAHADEALSMLAQFAPDILLSDIGMPTVDGYTLMRQVRRLPPKRGGQIPAIALTAYAGEINYQQAMAAGFQNHIAKPVEPDHLIDAIVALLKLDRQ